MINNEVIMDIPCYYCREDMGVKQIFNLNTYEPERGWYWCTNCGRHLYYAPEPEKRCA